MTDQPLDTFITNQLASGQEIGRYYDEYPSPITETQYQINNA